MSDSTSPETTAEGKGAEGAITRKKSRLTKTLPTDRIPLAKQWNIVSAIPAAYEKADSSPISFKEVGSIVDLSESTVAQISGFVNDVQLVIKGEGGKFTPCAELLEFHRAFGFDQDRAWKKLAPTFEKSWFAKELVPRIKVRGAIEEVEAIAALADISGAEKAHTEQLKIALEYLGKCGVIRKEGTAIRLNGAASPDLSVPKTQTKTDGPPIKEEDDEAAHKGLEKHSLTLDPRSGKKVVIYAPATLTAKELDRLQKWLGFQFIIEAEEEDMKQ